MNRVETFFCAVILLVFCFASAVAAEQDSTKNREAAADRYLKVVPMSKMLGDTFTEMAKQLPQDQRESFIRGMKIVVRVEYLHQLTRDSMIKTFTADELNALADFYGSKHGSSAMRKFGVYMAQVMPAIQSEVQRGLQQLEDERKK